MIPRRTTGWWAHLPCTSEHKRNLSAYLDGELDVSARAGVEAHFARCHSCWAQYNELRFASRAMAHFVLPEAPRSSWRPTKGRSQEAATLSALKKCWAMKVALPAPVFAGLLAAIIIPAAWLSTGRTNGMQQSVPAQSTVAATPQAKVIEVPVVREVLRERVVTRVVYARQPRPFASDPRRSVEEELPASTFIAGRRPIVRSANGVGAEFLRTSLAGFRPARTADLRIVKEPQQ
jgi:hypothetical protein